MSEPSATTSALTHLRPLTPRRLDLIIPRGWNSDSEPNLVNMETEATAACAFIADVEREEEGLASAKLQLVSKPTPPLALPHRCQTHRSKLQERRPYQRVHKRTLCGACGFGASGQSTETGSVWSKSAMTLFLCLLLLCNGGCVVLLLK